jgi:hypothetical protein
MRLPIDTQHLNFIAVGIPEAVVDFDTKQPRHDPECRRSSTASPGLHFPPIPVMRMRGS